jgi:hypothetical protein
MAMTHELGTVELLPAAEAIRRVSGVSPSKPTVRRWMRQGLRGVRLEGWFVAGRPVTTPEAASRFVCQTSKQRQI